MSTAATPNAATPPVEPDPAREFPEQASSIYLNHAASAPLPRRSREALRAYLDDRERLFHLYQAGRQDYDPTTLRRNLARLANAPVDRVAFVPTTTDGLSGALNGIDWRAGDNVVFGADEFPSVVYAALALERRGVIPRAVPVRDHLASADLLDAVDRRTRAVIASHVQWQTGHRIDLPELGRGCRALGVLSIIDAIQSLGAVPLDFSTSAIDVLVAGSYKWLFAIPGAAVLYASEPALERVIPDRAGWRSMATSVYATPRLLWAEGARRFEAGGQPDPTLIALDRSVELLLEIGIDRIYRRSIAAIDRLLTGLDGTNVGIRSSLEPAARSTIVSISTGTADVDNRLTKILADERVIVARRGAGIRIAPHWHNRDEDIDRTVEIIRAHCRAGVS